MSALEFRRLTARRYKQVRSGLRAGVQAALRSQPLMSEDYALAINTSQNVLREAMEVVFQNALPQPPEYFGEMAVRLACYALTALHPDMQERGALEVQKHILSKLADMQANGHVIKTEWQ